MAVSEASLHITLGVAGVLPDPDLWEAILRAQKKNAIIAEEGVKERARAEMADSKTDPDRDPRNRGDYPGSMVDYYHGTVNAEGDVVLDNPTARADYFEYGTKAHDIWASGLFARGNETPARGLRGQFSRGARALKFNMGGFSQRITNIHGQTIGTKPGGNPGFTAHVNHPGQEAKLVMYETMGDLLDEFATNVLDELEEEFSRG